MSDLGFSKIIGEIESHIETKYVGGAIQWCDEHLGGAWSQAIDRLHSVLSHPGVTPAQLDFEARLYRSTILGLIEEYRKHQGQDAAAEFLDDLEGQAHGL